MWPKVFCFGFLSGRKCQDRDSQLLNESALSHIRNKAMSPARIPIRKEFRLQDNPVRTKICS
jgi:hypothetical protein